ncbi:MAG: hypothetical protein JO115_20455 [Pseudonocardiales bacterium]|nr:hypothetical protein [Pseudonocardiales bacterium]
MSQTATTAGNPQLVVRVAPGVDEWGTRDDDRWRHDLYELEHDLKRALPDAVQPAPVRPDAKGPELIDVVLALASAGVVELVKQVFKTWLARKPDRRTLDVVCQGDNGTWTLRIDATNIDGSDIADILRAVDKKE